MRIRRIAIDDGCIICARHAIGVRLTIEKGILRFFSEVIQLCFREIGFFVAAERHVKLTAQIVTTQAVVTVAVQI